MAKILITIDHKWRDLPGYVYAGLLLEKLGHKVYYARNGLEEIFVPAIKPDLLILPHLLEKKKQEYAKYLKSHGVLVALLPTEGIPTLDYYRPFAAGVECDLSGVALQFVWNQPIKEILKKNKTISQDKIKVIGVPRFDFYKPPLSNLLITKKDFLEKYKFEHKYPIITFATNFTQAQFCHKNQNFFKEDARRLGYEKFLAKDSSGNLFDIAKGDYDSREISMNSFLSLVKDFNEVNFILKLHPSEDHTYYYDLLKRHPDLSKRIRIIVQEYIWDVLNVTDIELKRSCTTGIESWILGKPTIEMKLNPNEWYFSPEHASGSDVVTNYDELKKVIKYYLNGGTISEHKIAAREVFLRKWCCKVDGKSTQRLVGLIHDLLQTKLMNINLPFRLKEHFLYYLLKLTDYKIHDIKVYGLKIFLRRVRFDKLGRLDKYFHADDLVYWYNKFKNII